MPRRHRDNEDVRRTQREHVDGAKLMRRLAREQRSKLTPTRQAMQRAAERAGVELELL